MVILLLFLVNYSGSQTDTVTSVSGPDSVLFTEQHSCEVDSCGNIIVVSCELQRQLDRYCYQCVWTRFSLVYRTTFM